MGKKLKISRTNVAILSFEIEDLKKKKFSEEYGEKIH